MTKKPIALIVDDKPEWLKIFEEILESDFRIKEAQTAEMATALIQKHGKGIKLAIVDIRLTDKSDRSGLDILHALKRRDIPSIATSAYFDDDAQTVRDALILGGARDFWFKRKLETVNLRDMIITLLVNQGNTVPADKKTILLFFFTLLGLTLTAFLIISGVAIITSSNLVKTVIAAGITLSLLLTISFALFVGKITGRQFTSIIKEIFSKK